MARKKHISVHLCKLLRHNPQALGLHMDEHGWVDTRELVEKVNNEPRWSLTMEQLEQIVANDDKGRYRFSPDKSRIKCCQGHSIPWVTPELEYGVPPAVLYHGTHQEASQKILESGGISRMNRHGVHMTADPEMAWRSARRWGRKPVLLEVDAKGMQEQGFLFGCSENQVWCTETVPAAYILRIIEE